MQLVENNQTENPNMERYSRQVVFHGMGEARQRKLMAAKVAVIGCGGLGSALISLLTRAGFGELVIVDRDKVELSNLQRQILYTEADVAASIPKAVAAEQAIRQINSSIKVQSYVTEVTGKNIESIIEGCDVVLDGTDNLMTRYIINDACVKMLIPWVYGGVVASSGMSMTILPHDTACLRCVFPTNETPSSTGPCATEGVLGSIITMVASIQVAEAMKILIGESARLNRGMIFLDVWTNEYQAVQNMARNPECPCCGKAHYEYLEK
jgi:adenylyltransferase/sulfurtransferase